MRPHLSLNVHDVPASVAFYRKVFGLGPQKETTDYAKFDLSRPPLNFSLVSSSGAVSAVNHLGIEVADSLEVGVWERHLREQGILDKVQSDVTCCFARQDKVWFTDPDGNAWEVFTVHEQLPVTTPLKETGCCVPADSEAAESSSCGCR
jgi:catechol 2,3-dioxygenase-like lactoylglutathione lyase family enzyme